MTVTGSAVGRTTERVTGKPMHTVLVVDDSAFMRKLIGEMISAETEFHVIGFARNGVDALRQIATLDPDVVTLDLEMPQLDGMQVLEQVMARAPRRIVVLSGGGGAQGAATIRALELGAVDFVQKPSGPISLDLPRIRDRLIGALRTAVTIDLDTVRALSAAPRGGISDGRRASDANVSGLGVPRAAAPAGPRAATHVVVIASSTGGPRALADVIPALPNDLPAAVLVAQHMPKEFTASLAERLDHASAVQVREGVHGEPVMAGTVYVAPGGTNMRIERAMSAAATSDDATPPVARIAIEPADPTGGVCPSADLLFSSAAATFGRAVTAVVLTGMGRDGSDGVCAVRDAGGQIVVQDRETSVIYGMPNAALQSAGARDGLALRSTALREIALREIAPAIVSCVTGHGDAHGDAHGER